MSQERVIEEDETGRICGRYTEDAVLIPVGGCLVLWLFLQSSRQKFPVEYPFKRRVKQYLTDIVKRLHACWISYKRQLRSF